MNTQRLCAFSDHAELSQPAAVRLLGALGHEGGVAVDRRDVFLRGRSRVAVVFQVVRLEPETAKTALGAVERLM